MDEKELQEFSLDDIIKEFSDHPEDYKPEQETPEEPEQETPEEPEQAAAEEIPEEPASEEEPAPEEPEQEEKPAVSVTSDTIRLDKIPIARGQVRNAQRIDDEEEEAPVFVPEQEEKTEPFSEEWEPDYEQPIAEYIPPKPIIFHPKSRLRELKRKLVAGPEKMYYALSERGLGKVQAAIFFTVLVVLISAAAMAMYAVGWVQPERLKLMVFGQFLAMLICALLGYNQLLEGAADLFLRKRFTLNTLLVFTFVFCCVDGVLCLWQQRVPCCAAFGLQVAMSLWNSYENRNTRLGQLDTMRKATRLDSLTVVENYHDETKGVIRGEGQVEHFMDTLDQPARQEKTHSIYALVALCVSAALGVAAGVLHGLGGGVMTGVSTGFQVASVTCIAAMPASMFIVLSRPMAVLERRYHAVGTVLCGWQGVEALSGKVLFPVAHNDLLPTGSVQMNGVKFYGDRQPDEIIAYTTALIAAAGGCLEPVFTGLLDSRNGMHYTASNLEFYENEGVGGVVNGESVLVGTLAFMKEQGIEVPEGVRVNNAVCAAVEGTLCGLFAITFEKDRAAAAGLATLVGYRRLKTVVTSSDFVLTESFLKNHFDVKTKRILLPEHSVRAQLREKQPEEDAPAAALITGEGLAAYAYAATGARTLNSAATAGTVVHMVGGILGMVMMAVLAIIGRIDLLTPASMLLYELIWMIPGLLITEWTRSI